jgi:hypothetical protein
VSLTLVTIFIDILELILLEAKKPEARDGEEFSKPLVVIYCRVVRRAIGVLPRLCDSKYVKK